MYNEKDELAGLKNDSLIFDQKDEAFKQSFANELSAGLGAKIRNTLKNPTKMTRFQIIKYKIKAFFDTLIEIL